MIPVFNGQFLNDLSIDLGLAQNNLSNVVPYWNAESREDDVGELFTLWSSSLCKNRVNLFARDNGGVALLIKRDNEGELEIELQTNNSQSVISAFIETCSLLTSLKSNYNQLKKVPLIWTSIDPQLKLIEAPIH